MAKMLTPNHHPVNRSGLVGWWDYMNTGSVSATGTWKDYSGNGNDGTLTGNAYINNQGLNCNAGTDSSNHGTSASLRLTTAGTISTWIKASSLGADIAIVCKLNWGTDRNGYHLFFNGGTGNFGMEFASNSAFQQVKEGTSLDDGEWHQLVASWSTNVRMYIDGEQVGTATTRTVTPDYTTDYDLLLGQATGYSPAAYTGLIAGTQICNRALSAGEIQQNYLKNLRA